MDNHGYVWTQQDLIPSSRKKSKDSSNQEIQGVSLNCLDISIIILN